ncbi:MAG: sigma-54-dependent transcriptional regulator [Thermodesulfobacteriota bacterium]
MGKSPSILIVDDEPHSLFGLSQILREEGFHTITAESGKEALEKLEKDSVNLVITDERMADLSGMELLSEIRRNGWDIPVILITAYGSISMAVEALKKGAFYFFEKPIFNDLERFFTIVRQAIKAHEMERELGFLRREVSEKYSFPNIIGNHSKMLEIFEIIRRVAQTDTTILIQGESGTGKDLIAKTIHYNSLRRDKPLITINCGALTETLLTSELFGHTKGAFTGAVRDSMGRFQAADGGTIILDEIGEIPLHLQKTLLRVIEEKEFERVGDSRPIQVDVRIISITNRDLSEEVERGNFRKDLYYRLSVVPIRVPPLRERASDIPLLVNHFIKKYSKGKPTIKITPEVMDRLMKFSWPGNIRELANVIQQMIVLSDGQTITLHDLPPQFLIRGETSPSIEGKIDLSQIVSEIERKWVLNKLDEAEWNLEKAARLLGITRKMLVNRMKKYHIKLVKKK